jgi:hypothetical protein
MGRKKMTRDEAFMLLEQAIAFRNKAQKILDRVADGAPYGSLQNLDWLMFVNWYDADDILNESNIFGDQ